MGLVRRRAGEVVRELVGREGVDVHEKTYLHAPLTTLKEAIEKLDFAVVVGGYGLGTSFHNSA